MKWTPRRILLHVIIVLVALALPLLLPSSCGPAVRSEASLTGISNYPKPRIFSQEAYVSASASRSVYLRIEGDPAEALQKLLKPSVPKRKQV